MRSALNLMISPSESQKPGKDCSCSFKGPSLIMWLRTMRDSPQMIDMLGEGKVTGSVEDRGAEGSESHPGTSAQVLHMRADFQTGPEEGTFGAGADPKP